MKVTCSVLAILIGLTSYAAETEFLGPLQTIKKSFRRDKKYRHFGDKNQNIIPATDDSDVVRAVRDRRDLHFIQGQGMTVVKLLPDDNQGLRHQRWYVRLSDGSVVFAVYNIDMNVERVPVEMQQAQGIGGEFKWTSNGGLLHWLHYDPKNRRPDGYVDVNGKRYGDHYR